MADVVNPCLVWLSGLVKTHEGKAEDRTCHDFSSLSRQRCRDMGVYVEGSCLCRYYCTPHVMAWLPELTHSTSQPVSYANWWACYFVAWVVPSCQYHIYSVSAVLLGLLLRDVGKYRAYNPGRNNPGSSAALTMRDTKSEDWLSGFHRCTWIPGLVFKAPLLLPCLRPHAAHCAIAKEPNRSQKHACPSQGCT